MGDGEQGSGHRIRVHDPVLYTQLMNAADWSHVIENEGRQMQESLARREAEAALARQREQMKLDEVRRRLEQTMATRRERQLAEEQQKQQMKEFRERMSAVGRRHAELVSMCSAAQRREVFRTHRALLRLSRQREEELLRPIQEFIEEQLYDDESAQMRSEVRKAMMESYVAECNRLEKTALGGVFLDVIDPVSYDPFLQQKLCTIRYPEPPRPMTVVEAHRLEASETVKHYQQLALDYRKLQRESMTGALSAPSQAEDSVYTLTRCMSPSEVAVEPYQQTQGSHPPRFRVSRLPSPTRLRPPLNRMLPGGLDGTVNKLDMLKTLSTVARRCGMDAGPGHVVTRNSRSNEVMPLLGTATDENDQLLQWMSRRQRSTHSRFRDLPVSKWDRFTETALGWNAAADGSMKESLPRHRDAAYYRQMSRITFAHLPYVPGCAGQRAAVTNK
ncbi:hypothetical protein, conserved [Trypanosoma brucei gambiense DAL972]|uniref:Uncharacterized protein n=1 Tax=Trypanosoma brucei gambiense (strain MHOM/CI/86/DAL972) TaxID=679716 RepID=D0A9H3_TRYB9|nr:hypothetical protein, conserved [Trypanosoma brucei gambiense DAL972]CBH18324.1 hypothetical protein, conserved [Trypanosoma brucei gambiense DAL972]|eukprot:XP_011780588.1 hypothetical protein, conserved [Trypanosoma brucei gambiense DAL972]